MTETNPYRVILFFCFFIYCCVTFFACSGNSQRGEEPKKQITDTLPSAKPYSKPPSSYTDTLIINFSSAVFFNPDSIQMENFGKVSSENDYESMKHNCFYQMRNARMVIKKYWPKIKIVETSRARYLECIKSDKTKTIIDLDTKGDLCGILLFEPKKEPEIIDMMNVDTALGNYFTR